MVEAPLRVAALFAVAVCTVGAAACASGAEEDGQRTPGASADGAPPPGEGVPVYEWDPTWPRQPLPDNWVVGPVVGVSVDSRDHIWVVHRPRGALSGWQEECCVPAPAVIEFDQEGNVVQGWGGPPADEMPRATALPWQPPQGHTWVQSEHNIFVDHEDNGRFTHLHLPHGVTP